ncbi:DUF3568 family protein [Uliginosibacterium sp. H3]|uniref:DUF3568 family protein n=1 Tax=Uliginosibacterium silvisoli TaxID=3114758 RepID=A0ABU6K527_9RHOO|nr:DUF3568 family protein [Uliginosibacterium sp. H3]
MTTRVHIPQLHLASTMRSAARLSLGVCVLLLLNGCAALAVSLAGAGAGAGLSHQMNGTASRTFSEPFSKVDDASRIAAKRIFLQVDEVASISSSQVTKARVGDMDITLELEALSPNLTRVSVKARKDMFRVDGATAQEIVVQIERALLAMNLADAEANRSSINNAGYSGSDLLGSRKGSSPPKKKGTI